MSASSGGTDLEKIERGAAEIEIRVGRLSEDVAQLLGGENLVFGGGASQFISASAGPLLRNVHHASPVSSGTAVNPSVRKSSGSNVKTWSTSRSSASTLVA